MQLTEEAIKKFQRVFHEVYGADISREEAVLYGSQLVQLVKLIYKPIKVGDLNQHTKLNSN